MVVPRLHTLVLGTILEILDYLDDRQLYVFGCTCKRNFMLFLREKESRKSLVQSASTRFLPRGWKRETVALVSYPRSGNSFLRRELEKWSGTITGSDTRPNRTLSASLLRCGFRGEGITDDSVWLVKTHFPERMGYIKFPANRAVLIIRNPFDTIESYFHLGMTNTHDKSLSPSAFQDLRSIWEEFVFNEIKIWKLFYSYWLDEGRVISSTEWGSVVESKQSEILVVRYEDLLLHKQNVKSLMFSFLGGKEGKSPLGVKFPDEEYHDSATQPTSDNGNGGEPGYKPRQNGSVGKSLQRYSKYQIETMKEIIGESFLSGLGYNVLYNESNNGEENEADKYIDLKPMLIRQFIASINNSASGPCDNYHGTSSYAEGRLIVNSLYSLRKEDDRFGRLITYLRKSLTNDDSEPFETL